ncbi:MAG: hypothetical protein ABF990_13280 [Acetobacter sp.]|uniref:hypothetical protein n=1 Tax=Acetobacter sp. TaxID=440 RepID=UPI0039EA9507
MTCGLLLVLGALGLLCVLPAGLARGRPPWLGVLWRPELAGGLWALAGLAALLGAVLRLEGAPDWFPVFGLDGPALPMLVLLAFIGAASAGQGRCPNTPQLALPAGHGGAHGLACVLAGFAFLAMSPLVFGLFASLALALLDGRGKRALCLPFAVLPACIAADNVLSVPLLCLSIVQTGWAVSMQRGPAALLPACIGLFLLGRILAETGTLPLLATAGLLLCGAWVAVRGCLRALDERSVQGILAGFGAAWYGGMVVDLTLALASVLDGADAFRMAVELAMGAPVLALLGLQLLAVRYQAGQMVADGRATGMAIPRAGRVLASLCLFQLAAVPPFGVFAVLWTLLLAGDYSVQGARPVVAVGVVVLLALRIGVVVLAGLGLLRAGLHLLLPRAAAHARADTRHAIPVQPGGGEWTGWICALVGGAVAVCPGVWLYVADPMVAPTALGDATLPLTWGGSFVVGLAQGESRLTPMLVLAAMTGAVGVALLLVRVMGFAPLGRNTVQVPLWRQGAPRTDSPGTHDMSGNERSPMPVWPAVLGLGGFAARSGATGGGGAGAAYRHDLARRGRVVARFARRLVFRGAQWCESRSMVLIVLLLGLGLLVGLFAGP